MGGSEGLTAFPAPNFFSVPITFPLRCAAFSAALPLITVSRLPPPLPRVLLPILVTVSQSSIVNLVLKVILGVLDEKVCVGISCDMECDCVWYVVVKGE